MFSLSERKRNSIDGAVDARVSEMCLFVKMKCACSVVAIDQGDGQM